MKKILLPCLCLVCLLSGCAMLTQAPSESAARKLEEDRRADERSMSIQSRAAEYQRAGVDLQNAQLAAESEASRSGSR